MGKLGIGGKTVDISNIAKKTKAQFFAQLKQAGVEIDDSRAEAIYQSLHADAVERERVAAMSADEKEAYNKERQAALMQEHPEYFEKAVMAKARAEALREALEAKFKKH